jgi:ADP-heptose:LPS heptosyltransferase
MSEQGFSVLVTGTKSENDISQSICDKADGAVNIAGKTDLKTLVALLAKASLVVSNDTGPGHIAGALCTPLVMIFGPSNPRRIYPYQRPETLAAVEPFDRGKALFSPSPRHAIDAVTVDMVYDKACQQLKTHKPQHN